MLLAAHQPAFLPDISFLAKLVVCDVMVLTDDFPFSTRSRINRCRIKTTQGGNWLTIPVLTAGMGQQLNYKVQIESSQNWRRRHLKSLQVNYCYAAYYEPLIELLAAVYHRDWPLLCEFNIELIRRLCDFLKLKTRIVLSSEMRSDGDDVTRMQKWLEDLDCSTYLADSRYAQYLKTRWPHDSDNLRMVDCLPVHYHQQFGDFVANLSMIDIVFNEGPASIGIARQSLNML